MKPHEKLLRRCYLNELRDSLSNKDQRIKSESHVVDANTATDEKELFSSVNYILVILANFIHEDKTQQNKENNCLTLKSPISTCVFSLQFSYISYVTCRENLY